MSVVTVARKLSSPVAQVWDTQSDFGGIHRWSAGVEPSPINDGTPAAGVGSERYCTFYDGNHLAERVTESVARKKLAIEIIDTSMPIEDTETTFSLAPSAGSGTELTVVMDYTVKFGPLGLLMMRRMMTGNFNNLLAALDQHLQTGEAIGKGWKPVEASA